MADCRRPPKPKRPMSSRIHSREEEEEHSRKEEEEEEETQRYGHRVGGRPYYILHLDITEATNAEILIGPFRTLSGLYQIIVTDSKYRREFRSAVVRVGPNPEPFWGCSCKFRFDELPEYESLYVEVLQYKNESDPGTSNGVIVVGKAKIPVPVKLRDRGWRVHKLFRLVGLEKKIVGAIVMKMELQEVNSLN